MYFRFLGALVLVGLVSLAGIALEKQTLEVRRRISRQHYQLDALLEQRSRLRLQVENLRAPGRLLDSLDTAPPAPQRPQAAVNDSPSDAGGQTSYRQETTGRR